jgi:hypothetical protein
MLVSSIICDLACISAVSLNLHSLAWVLIFGDRGALEVNICSFFGFILQVLAHRKSVLCLVVIQQMGHKFSSHLPHL